ncbi:hypothetical protein [Roseibacillus ishigakijimensis]|uniref:hypothetical protein n=1 Tax=Roseibacillus ishigakijimensis TaxID=454146 RepID=UPI00190761EE|nr:hypothetical protein [Roseibacillus ishigakijimensis]
MKPLLSVLALSGGLLLPATGHVVEQLYAEWRAEGEEWQLEIQFDAGYADPETRNEPFAPAPLRRWLLAQSEETWARQREEAARYLAEMLIVRCDERELSPQLSFPDWETRPPDFPQLINGAAYFRVLWQSREPGRLEVGVREGDFPKLIVERGSEFLLLAPGESTVLRSATPQTEETGSRPSLLRWLPGLGGGLLLLLLLFRFFPSPKNEIAR